jgi:DNA-binding transcriptional ArsR family regulator
VDYHVSNPEGTCQEAKPSDAARDAYYADILAAMGAEPRLRIMRLLLSAHPEGLVVGDIQDELGIAPSTLSHHLEKLKNEGLVTVRRQGRFLRYTADIATLEDLVRFLFAECCSGGANTSDKFSRICR